jgi:hypothetical protein
LIGGASVDARSFVEVQSAARSAAWHAPIDKDSRSAKAPIGRRLFIKTETIVGAGNTMFTWCAFRAGVVE